MAFVILVSDLAIEDLSQGLKYYNGVSGNIKDIFGTEVKRSINNLKIRLQEDPSSPQYFEVSYVKSFPYTIYSWVEGYNVYIQRILHNSM